MIFYRSMRRHAVRIVGERSSTLDMARGRLAMMGGVYMLAFMLLAALAFDLSIIQTMPGRSAKGPVPQGSPQKTETAQVRRGNIFDRNGVILASSIKTASLYADTHLISDLKGAAANITRIFPDMAYGDVLQSLQSRKRFIWLRRHILPEQQQAILMLGEPGLGFAYEDKRLYPQGALTAHLVGFTNVDNHGLAGMERGFDSMLADGEDIHLTLDVRLQHALRREMQRAMDDFSALGAAGVIMDARTGEVLAGVSLPDFDPLRAGKSKAEDVFNRLTQGVYELGSVFKIFSTAAFLENYDVPMSATFDARQPLQVGRFTINDYHAENRMLTIPEVFMYSSNIGSAMMGQAVGTEKLRSFYNDVGLLSPLSFEIRETGRPIVPSPWREISTLTAAYGHGVATTPLQFTAAVASVLNGGLLVRPGLIMKEKTGNDLRPSVRIVSEETSRRLRELMRLTVSQGTGTKANVDGFSVGGKTGTAEKSVNGRYDQNRLMSSFVAAFPMQDPRYVIFVAFDEPKGNSASRGYATAGWVAAPVVARVVESMAAILDLQPQGRGQAPDIEELLRQFVAFKPGRGVIHEEIR